MRSENPKVKAALHQWWVSLVGHDGQQMPKEVYIAVGVSLMQAFAPEEGMDDICGAVEDDWVKDTKGTGQMDYGNFCDSMVRAETAHWCPSP